MFNATVLDHTLNPRNAEPLKDATHMGLAGEPGEGPYVQLWFVVEGERIVRGAYQTYGCPAAVACASLAAELLAGRTVAQALDLTPRDIELLLGGLPEGKGHCPNLVVKAIARAFEGAPL